MNSTDELIWQTANHYADLMIANGRDEHERADLVAFAMTCETFIYDGLNAFVGPRRIAVRMVTSYDPPRMSG